MTNPRKDPLVGTRVREYEILDVIGKGGMGAVYRARHVFLDQERAIKVIRTGLSEEEDFVGRFVREAKILSQLQHPNLVHLYEFGSLNDETFFMVMELIRGESVLERIRRVSKIPVHEAVGIIRQAALGLHSAHQKGIVHRDISPDNLMLVKSDSGEEITKVLDFGIAKPLMESGRKFTMTNVFIGKPEYCSPEQCGVLETVEEIDRRSDIYSLGITLYYMIAGRLPFNSLTPEGFLVKHAVEVPKPLNTVMPGSVPEALNQAIQKALAKKPQDRYSTMDEFAKVLSQIDPGAKGFLDYYSDGKAYYDQMEWSQAIGCWQKALEASPGNESIQQWLDAAKRKQEDEDAMPQTAAAVLEQVANRDFSRASATLEALRLNARETSLQAEVDEFCIRVSSINQALRSDQLPSAESAARELSHDSQLLAPCKTQVQQLIDSIATARIRRSNMASVPPKDLPPPARPVSREKPEAPPPVATRVPLPTPVEKSGSRYKWAVIAAIAFLLAGIAIWWQVSPFLSPPKPPAPVMSNVTVNALPWAHVKITPKSSVDLPKISDQEKVTPCHFSLPQGIYTLELSNPAFTQSLTTEITVQSGKTNSFVLTMPQYDPSNISSGIIRAAKQIRSRKD